MIAKPMTVSIPGLEFLEACAHRWEGLKSKVKAFQRFEKILKRSIPENIPEATLLCAVIAQAAAESVEDVRKSAFLDDPDSHKGYEAIAENKADAIAFFSDGRLEKLCNLCGLDHEFVLEMYRKMVAHDDPGALHYA